jgi:hypothetical protein
MMTMTVRVRQALARHRHSRQVVTMQRDGGLLVATDPVTDSDRIVQEQHRFSSRITACVGAAGW